MFSKIIIISSIGALMISIGCSKILTKEKLNIRAGFLPTPRKAKADCDVNFVIKLPEDSSQYELVGTCLAKKNGKLYSIKNKAVKSIKKCACYNGGELVRVVSAKEYTSTLNVFFNGLPDFLNPNSPRYIEKDHVLANVYRLKVID